MLCGNMGLLFLVKSKEKMFFNRTRQNPVKVTMVLYYYDPYISGLSIMVKRLAEGLVKQGYDVTVLTSRYNKELPKKEIINGVSVVRRPVLFSLGKGVIMPSLIWDIIRYSYKSDFINPYLPLAESGLAALLIPKRKIITGYVCDIYLGPKIFERLITFISITLMHLQLLRSSIVTSLSDDYFKHSKMKRYLYKSVPAYPPVALDEFTKVDPSNLITKLKLTDEIKIGFVGRIVYEKGIGYLLNAVPELEKNLPSFKILIAGDYTNVAGGGIKEELDKYIEKYPNKIIFTGYLSDKERNQFYSCLDVLVLPSIDPLEAFGMVQVEAMLCGTPVVASNLPGVREVIQKTGYGKICEIKNSKDIASQIIEVVTNRHSYQPDAGKVAQAFDPQKSIDTYAQLMMKK